MEGKVNGVILLLVIGYISRLCSAKCVSSNLGLAINCTETFLGNKIRGSITMKLCQWPPTLSLKLDTHSGNTRSVIIEGATGINMSLGNNYYFVISLKALNLEGKVNVSIKLKHQNTYRNVVNEILLYKEIVKDGSCGLELYLYNSLFYSVQRFDTWWSEEDRRAIMSQSTINTYINALLRYEIKYKSGCVISNGGLTVRCNEAIFSTIARYGVDIKLCQESPTVSLYLDINDVNIHYKRTDASVITIPIPSVDNSSLVLTLMPVSNDGKVDIGLKIRYNLNPNLAKINNNINVIDIPIYKETWRDPKCDAKRFWHNSVRTGVLATIRNAVLKKQKFDDTAQLFVKKYISELYPSKSSSVIVVNNHELTLSYVAKFLGKEARIGVDMILCRCAPAVMLTLNLQALGIHVRKNDTFIDASIATNISVRLTTSTSYAVNRVQMSVKLVFFMAPFNVTLADITLYDGSVRNPTCNVVCNDKPIERCNCDSVVVGFVVFLIVAFIFASALGGYCYYRRRIRNKEVPQTDFTTGKGSDGRIPRHKTPYEMHENVPI